MNALPCQEKRNFNACSTPRNNPRGHSEAFPILQHYDVFSFEHRPKSNDDIEDVEAAALILAAKEAFPDATVEIVFLSDQKIEPLSMTTTKLENRKVKLDNALSDIRSGKFPPEPSIRSCPGCPAFFVCGPIPKGVLQKKF